MTPLPTQNVTLPCFHSVVTRSSQPQHSTIPNMITPTELRPLAHNVILAGAALLPFTYGIWSRLSWPPGSSW
jgi:hypothetical protein